MKHTYKKLICLSSLVMNLTCGLPLAAAASESTETTIASTQAKEGTVKIDPNLAILKLDAKAKDKLYAELDQINKDEKGKHEIHSYPTIKEIDSDKAFDEIMKQSEKESVIIYLGYDECPFCKAFSPKLTHLTQETKQTVYFYDVKKRVQDPAFRQHIDFFKVTTVPHAFIVKKGKVEATINDQSKMQDIEDFVLKAQKD
ncbi:thioredoxin domain-containing protein [Vaginisenegalia massiliensis]|uniref:thioredoxin domain-containing protein n=1 Tax=Vaginisenegalia massiliensis TaxID=2058294 RepID=UPI0013DE31A7|nr:thioredoxin domain-containing protein [Vaginisenegalia massiliensis]